MPSRPSRARRSSRVSVGQQIGLAPIFTLLALYAGYKTIGVPGMILFPICAVLFRQLWDHSGLQNSWKSCYNPSETEENAMILSYL